MTLSQEELDRARCAEALRIYEAEKRAGNLFTGFGMILCRLVRDNWQPPADSLTLAARQVVTNHFRATGVPCDEIKEFEDGLRDDGTYVILARLGVERGIEIMRRTMPDE